MDSFTDIVLDYITDGDVPENFTDTVRDFLEAMFEGVEGLILDDLNVTVNGTYLPASGHAYRRVDVNVESPSIDLISLNVAENGEYTPPVGKAYNRVVAAVPNTYSESDEGKVVSGGSLVQQTPHSTVTENGTIDTTLNNSVTINVPTGGSLPSVITKIDGGSFTLESDTTGTGHWISHNLGVVPKGVIIWTDDSDLRTSTAAVTQRYLLCSTIVLLDWVTGTTSNGAIPTHLFRNTNGATSNTGSPIPQAAVGNYFQTTRFNNALGSAYYKAGVTYKWLAWC